MYHASYGATEEESKLGWLQKHSSEEEEDDDGAVKSMVPGGEDDIEEFTIPDPSSVAIIYLPLPDGSQFVFDIKRIPLEFAGSPTSVYMAATDAKPLHKAISDFKAAACFQPCLPIILHGSPLVSLISNKFALPPDLSAVETEEARRKEGTITKPKYCSFIYSVTQLKQITTFIQEGCYQFRSSMSPTKLKALEDEFTHQLRRHADDMDYRLDQYYDQAGDFQKVDEFLQLMEQYALRYIHIHEWFIYQTLLAPLVPLSLVLTPLYLPSLMEVSKSQQKDIVEDAGVFFHHKQEHQGFQYEYMKSNDGYKGYVSWDFLQKYKDWLEDKR